MEEPRSAAPGRLDQVRALLNTWHVPHQHRIPVDDLPGLLGHPRDWRRDFPDLAVPTGTAVVDELTALRADLRECLGEAAPRAVAGWIDRHPVTVTIGDPDEPIEHRGGDGTVGQVLALVTAAIARGRWARLKACPDCRHVFYDHSRNRSRTWCGMYSGGTDGRACGTIAKVRAYRDRRAATGT